MEEKSAQLFVVRPWHEGVANDQDGNFQLIQVGWMFQYDDGPKWYVMEDSGSLRALFIDLGDL